MHAIADEEPDADSAARLHGRILTWEIQLARARNDAARITAKFQDNEMKLTYKGKLNSKGDELKLTSEGGQGGQTIEWNAKRVQ